MTTELAGVELRTASQVRAQLGEISEVTLWRRIRNPVLAFPKPIKILGRNYFLSAEIDHWIEAQVDATRALIAHKSYGSSEGQS